MKLGDSGHHAKACPACRTPAWLVLIWERTESGRDHRFAVRCDNCVTLGPWGASKALAVIAWNGEIEIQRRASATGKRRAAR